jgi:hypothetical protein
MAFDQRAAPAARARPAVFNAIGSASSFPPSLTRGSVQM